MRKLLYYFMALVTASCIVSACKKELSARETAEKYYGYLIKGDVDAYMRGMADYDSLPEGYRQQLRDMFLQHIDEEQKLRNGICAARAVGDTVCNEVTHVFVLLTYGDSTSEQVSLPMVLTDKGWRMK